MTMTQLPADANSRSRDQEDAVGQSGPEPDRDGDLEPGVWTYEHYLRHWQYINSGRPPPDDGVYDKTTQKFAQHLKVGGSIADVWARETYADLKVDWMDNCKFIGDAMGDEPEHQGNMERHG